MSDPKNFSIENPVGFLKALSTATSTKAIKDLLGQLPVVPEAEYVFSEDSPHSGWRDGWLHWYAVGADRGNAGRIKLAGFPENPIAERTVNAMEALIELSRRRELAKDPGAKPPTSPRDAVLRYFSLPPLDELPKLSDPINGQKPFDHARDFARRIRVRLVRELRPVEYSVIVEDEGIGQGPERMHSSLLSLGSSDKGDKPYLIGLFGQGGSSAYATSRFSWLLSKRAPDLVEGHGTGIGWTIVMSLRPPGRRDPFFAYLAAGPDGRVPFLPEDAAKAIGLEHGTKIAHVNYDFGRMEPARTLYPALNHLLFNPVLPYELYTKPDRRPDPMWGNGYRLSKLKLGGDSSNPDPESLDKLFQSQTVERKGDEQ